MMTRTHPDRGHPIGRGIGTLAGLLVLGACSGAPSEAPGAAGASLPDGYALRLDRVNRDRANFVVTEADGGLTVSTGPAGILYRIDGRVDADRYTVRARFTEVNAPVGHREGFGLFVGGQELGGDAQRYLYFLVRGDGRYLVKRREGEATTEISAGWQPSAAIRMPGADGAEVANALAVAVENGLVTLSVNGEAVARLELEPAALRGVAGVRVNHNLAVRIEQFAVEP